MSANAGIAGKFCVDFTRVLTIFVHTLFWWSGVGHPISLAKLGRNQYQLAGGLHGHKESPMPRHRIPEDGYKDPTTDAIGSFLDGDDRLERQILELNDQLSDLKRKRHDHRNEVIVRLKLFTPPIEAAKKFAASHTPLQCRMDVIGRFLTYRQLGIFAQQELFDDPIIRSLESCMATEAA